METMTIREIKSNLSEVLKKVMSGEEVAISYGKNKEIVARIIPESRVKKPKRKIGLFEGKAKVIFKKNFSIIEEEFLDL